MMCFSSLYPRHLCRGVYSFRLSVRPFICSFVCTSIPFVKLLQSFTCNQLNDLCAQRRLCTQWVAKSARFFMRTAKTDQTGQMPRLICVFLLRMSFCWFCHAAAHILDEVPSLMMCFSSFYHKIMFSAVKNAKAIPFSYLFTVTCTSNIDSACTLNLLPHTYMYMLCFYYSGDTESFFNREKV